MNLEISIPGVEPTPEEKTVAEIWRLVNHQALRLLNAYHQLRAATGYTATGTNRYGLTIEEAFAAIEKAQPGGLTAQDLGDLAKISKAVINHARPGTIADEVPEATITLPKV